MVDPNVVSRRLLSLNEALQDLGREGASDARTLAADRVLRAAVERWLQIAIEACADIADHVIASEGWTPPSSAREAFLTLAGHGELDVALAGRLGDAVALRNILVHEYAALDLARLAAAVRDDLGDLRAFARQAAEWIT